MPDRKSVSGRFLVRQNFHKKISALVSSIHKRKKGRVRDDVAIDDRIEISILLATI